MISKSPILDLNQENIPYTIQKSSFVEIVLYVLIGFSFYLGIGYLLSLLVNFEKISYSLHIIISTGVNFLVFSFLFYFLGIKRKKITFQSIGLRNFKFESWWLFAIPIIVLVTMPIRSIFGILTEYIVHGDFSGIAYRSAMLIPEEFSVVTFLISFVGIGVLAPIAEELFFRGLIHTILVDHLAFLIRILLSSLIFSFGHYDSVGVMVASFIMGIVLAMAYEKTKSLWFPIGIHIVNNSISVFLIYGMLLIEKSI